MQLERKENAKMQKEEFMSVIKERNTSIPKLAKQMGINKTTLYRKIEKDSFLVKDVIKIKRILDLSKKDIEKIFL